VIGVAWPPLTLGGSDGVVNVEVILLPGIYPGALAVLKLDISCIKRRLVGERLPLVLTWPDVIAANEGV
jgi:hypothetical protein